MEANNPIISIPKLPNAIKCKYFSQNSLECSETKEYVRTSVKNLDIFKNIFLKGIPYNIIKEENYWSYKRAGVNGGRWTSRLKHIYVHILLINYNSLRPFSVTRGGPAGSNQLRTFP